MNLLEAKTWTGKLFVDGWRAGGGGERAVIEPATGGELGRVGMANPADVRKAAARAAEAQRAWATE
jgi:benzaldehyde dehydrogenase (NAD)